MPAMKTIRPAHAAAPATPPRVTWRAAPTAPPEAALARLAAGPDAPDETPAWAARLLENVLTATCWLDPGEHGEPGPVTVWFSGRRVGVTGKPRPGDTFSHQETFDGVAPGTGPVAVTAQIRGINPGEWTVTARPVARAGSRLVRPYPPSRHEMPRRQRWPLRPRRVVIPAGPRAVAHTAALPFTKVPGITRPAYAGLISLGVLAGLGLQTLLLDLAGLPAGRALMFSVLAVVAGLTGGKAWFVAVHRGRRLDGWCIQGFITGAAAVAASAPLAGLGIPAGAYLGAAAPVLLIGMAIGRPGCFWAGCCVGKPTASCWGIWSSDRRLGCRRIPAQLLEALLSLLIGLATLVAALQLGLAQSGPVAIAALAAYTLGRQFILRLRANPARRAPHSGLVAAATAAAVLIVSVSVLA